jgi:hypothetical protein
LAVVEFREPPFEVQRGPGRRVLGSGAEEGGLDVVFRTGCSDGDESEDDEKADALHGVKLVRDIPVRCRIEP